MYLLFCCVAYDKFNQEIKMEFAFDFVMRTISTNVVEFLEENFSSDKEKECLRTIIKGKKLQYWLPLSA